MHANYTSQGWLAVLMLLAPTQGMPAPEQRARTNSMRQQRKRANAEGATGRVTTCSYHRVITYFFVLCYAFGRRLCSPMCMHISPGPDL